MFDRMPKGVTWPRPRPLYRCACSLYPIQSRV